MSLMTLFLTGLRATPTKAIKSHYLGVTKFGKHKWRQDTGDFYDLIKCIMLLTFMSRTHEFTLVQLLLSPLKMTYLFVLLSQTNGWTWNCTPAKECRKRETGRKLLGSTKYFLIKFFVYCWVVEVPACETTQRDEAKLQSVASLLFENGVIFDNSARSVKSTAWRFEVAINITASFSIKIKQS